jgi:mercuric ion transport protein
MRNQALLRTGLIGTVIAALCCFTPVLVILLGALGLSTALGWLDYLLFPVLAIFVGITVYALVQHPRKRKVQSDLPGMRAPKDGNHAKRSVPVLL